jgi:hypothetical protein
LDGAQPQGFAETPRILQVITVTKTQSLPSISPKDDGSFLVALAAHEQPTDNTWWLWPLGGGVLAIAAGLVTWLFIRRRKPSAALSSI